MNVHGAYSPSLAELEHVELRGNSVVIFREIAADLDTPVSAFLKIQSGGPAFLLESVEGGEQLGRYSFIGADPRSIVRMKDGRIQINEQEPELCDDPLVAIKALVDRSQPALGPVSRFDGGVLGYLSYEAVRYFERVPLAGQDVLGLPDAALMDVDTLLIFDHVKHVIRIVSHVWFDRPLALAYAEAAKRVDDLADRLATPLPAQPVADAVANGWSSNMPREQFEGIVQRAKEHIVCGDLLQIVLSQRLTLPYSANPFDLYRRLRRVSPSPYLYFLDFGDHQLVGASPELLVQVEGTRVVSRPIAGTRRRGRTREEDQATAEELLADEKECAEHLMLVDLARNDIGRISVPGSVQVKRFMKVDLFSHVMHIVSDVEGQLRPDCTAYDALRATFPAGTLSGAPKIRAMQIIAALEHDRRGAYGGAVGFINTHGDMEMAITIRTGVVIDGQLHVQAGAGIVADSEPANEYEETLNKARALIQVAENVP